MEKSEAQDYIPEGITMIHAPEVWDQTQQGQGAVIAVIDTGIDKDHPDLKTQIIGGRDFTGTGDFDDDNGHGTHVSGTILAAANGQGVAGVAPKAKVLALKALDAQGSGEESWINAALRYAINWTGPQGEKVNIISMSLGGPADPQEHRLIQRAVQNNILVVCAAGNSGDGNPNTDEQSYPGAYPEVVEVGAVDFQRNIADFSNTNSEIDLVAPGVNIISCYPGGRYAQMSGTSMATPHVSGAAALLRHNLQDKSERKLYAELIKHTTDLGLSRNAQGNGVLDLVGETRQQPRKRSPLWNCLKRFFY
ncbi:S8 family peptidase [Pullulanibacillus pueri]|nr:S8 family peptidase [Pullulanibacillus pueri]